MKALTLLFALLISAAAGAQQTTHGTIYGNKPNGAGAMDPSKVQAFMGNKIRVTATLKGKIVKVTKAAGGWFELAGADGKVIQAHFKTAGINIPESLAGRYVIADGIVSKQLTADAMQHHPGDTKAKESSSGGLSFEVTGLEVDR